MTWRDQAACYGVDTEVFYAHEAAKNPQHRDRTARIAFNICDACPVRTACLEDALTDDTQHGIRGGTYAKTRVQMIALGKRGTA